MPDLGHWAKQAARVSVVGELVVRYNSSRMNASASEGKPASKSKRGVATVGLVAASTLSLMVGVAQEPERFDVVSVRPHKIGDQNSKPPVFQPGGRFIAAAPRSM